MSNFQQLIKKGVEIACGGAQGVICKLNIQLKAREPNINLFTHIKPNLHDQSYQIDAKHDTLIWLLKFI